jgi:hypothetical protein
VTGVQTCALPISNGRWAATHFNTGFRDEAAG